MLEWFGGAAVALFIVAGACFMAGALLMSDKNVCVMTVAKEPFSLTTECR